jgi:hypothetical protein
MKDFETAWLEGTRAREGARRVVFGTAVFSNLLAILYLIGLAGKLIVDGTFHSTSSQPVQVVSAVVAILLDISLLMLFIALRRQISGSNVICADLACVFITLMCATSTINWFAQIAILPRLAAAGDAAVALIDVHQESSLMYAVEHLGWGLFYGLATLSIAAAMSGGKLESWIRR